MLATVMIGKQRDAHTVMSDTCFTGMPNSVGPPMVAGEASIRAIVGA